MVHVVKHRKYVINEQIASDYTEVLVILVALVREVSYDDSVGLGSFLYYAFVNFEVDSKDDEKILNLIW